MTTTPETWSPAAWRDYTASGEGNWTEYMKAFNGRLYRPDSAPADVGEGQPLPLESVDASKPLPTLDVKIPHPLFEWLQGKTQ